MEHIYFEFIKAKQRTVLCWYIKDPCLTKMSVCFPNPFYDEVHFISVSHK